MSALIVIALALVAITGPVVVLTRDPRRQIFVLSANGVVLAFLFFVLQSPDVALSEIAVGTAFVPLLYFATLTAVANERERDEEEEKQA